MKNGIKARKRTVTQKKQKNLILREPIRELNISARTHRMAVAGEVKWPDTKKRNTLILVFKTCELLLVQKQSLKS